MAGIKIKIPKGSKGFVDIKSVRELNPKLRIFNIGKKFKKFK